MNKNNLCPDDAKCVFYCKNSHET